MTTRVQNTGIDRRCFLTFCAGFGLAGTAVDVLWGAVQSDAVVTTEILEDALTVAGFDFDAGEREMMLEGVRTLRGQYDRVREVPLDNSIAPALRFDPRLPGTTVPRPASMSHRLSREVLPAVPANREEVAFWPVTRLAQLIRTRQVSAVDLTEMYLERLRRYDPVL